MWVQQCWWWWWWRQCTTGVAASSQCVSSYVEYSDCCLCASSIGGSTTAQNRFRCWCWCAEDREPASQPTRSSLARDSTLTDCCCSMLPSLRLLFFSAFFFSPRRQTRPGGPPSPSPSSSPSSMSSCVQAAAAAPSQWCSAPAPAHHYSNRGACHPSFLSYYAHTMLCRRSLSLSLSCSLSTNPSAPAVGG